MATGVETGVCTLDPSHTSTREIPIDLVDGHDYGEWIGTVTCTEAGTGTRVCSLNEEHTETTDNLQPLGHNYTYEETTPATCTTAGVETGTCTHDNSHTTTRETAIDPTAHVWGEWQGTVTCTQAGAGIRVCTLNEEHTEEGDTIPALGHNYEYEPTTAPTCTTAGVETGTCTHDNSHTTTRPIVALGHDSGEWHTALEPDCITAGSKELRCTRDNAVLNTEAVAALGHDWIAGPDAHTLPTCTAVGYGSELCTRCPEIRPEGEIPALGHTFENYVQTHAATCIAQGSKTADCVRKADCGVTDTQTIPIDPTAHNWNNSYTVTTPATCTVTGIETDTCTRSATHIKTQTIAVDPDAHNYQWVTTAPTFIEEGVEKEICTHNNLHIRETRVIDPLPITTTQEWNDARTQLNGKTGSYTLNIGGSFSVAGSTANTFSSAYGSSVTLKGSGTLSLSSSGNILRMSSSGQTLIIDSPNLTLRGLSSNNTSLVYVNGGRLELRNGTITGNTNVGTSGGSNVYGGGVYVADGAGFTMSGGSISSNTASTTGTYNSWGGGVYVYRVTFTMTGGTITSNTASGSSSSGSGGFGGGVYVGSVGGTFLIVTGTISGSVSGSNRSGAALYNLDGTAQRGTIGGANGTTWNSMGNLSTADSPIRVLDGELVSIGNITAPTWSEGGPVSLTAPTVTLTGLTAQGWQVSDNGSSGWSDFTPPSTADYVLNGKYLRYYAAFSDYFTLYSNTVVVTVTPVVGSITAPTWTEGGPVSLTAPTIAGIVTTQGWQISDNGSSGWSDFTASTADYVLNGKYLRYYATSSGGTTYYSNTVTIRVALVEMVSVPGGSFQLGKDLGTAATGDVTPVSTVTISSFYIGKYEVTQAQWQVVMGITIQQQQALQTTATDNYGRGDAFPIYYVNWYEALVFCNKLSVMEGLTPAYRISNSTDPSAWGTVPTSSNATWDAVTIVSGSTGYRLPTEAQWEYAAKGGNTGEAFTYAGSNTVDNVAWYGVSSANGGTSHAVGTKAPNGLGLYDMSGNVREWCWDWYGSYTSTAKANPTGASSGSTRVERGGSWLNSAEHARSAYRGDINPVLRGYFLGFRLVRPVN